MTKAVRLHGHTVALEMQNEGTIEEPQLAYRLYSEQPLSEEDHAAIADRIRFFLSLDDNLQPFYLTGQADPQFAPVIERLCGLHQPKFLTPFEIACWAVLGQRVPWRIVHRTKMALLPNHRHCHIQSEAHPASMCIRRRIVYRERCHFDGQCLNHCPGRF